MVSLDLVISYCHPSLLSNFPVRSLQDSDSHNSPTPWDMLPFYVLSFLSGPHFLFTQSRFHYYVNFLTCFLDSLAPFSLHSACFAKSKLFSPSVLLLSACVSIITAGEMHTTPLFCAHVKYMSPVYSLSHLLPHSKFFSHILTLTWEPSFLLCMRIQKQLIKMYVMILTECWRSLPQVLWRTFCPQWMAFGGGNFGR